MQKDEHGNTPQTVLISRRGADRLRLGHVWVYRSDLIQVAGIPPGALVTVKDQRNKVLGSALYSTASEIAIRMISSKPVENLDHLVRERIRSAVAYRGRFVQNTNAYRVIFSEGDCLPGLIVDRYNDIVSVQALTQAMDADPMRTTVLSELQATLSPTTIVERVDPRVRRLEQLPEKDPAVIFSHAHNSPNEPAPSEAEESASPAGAKTTTEFHMNGVRFVFDALAGQKTGAFLDQREIEWIEANAFDLLRDYSDANHKYDCIVLDPPAFAKSRRELPTALRGYKELNLRALKMLRPGGILVTCSCSYHVSAADLLDTVASAALDSHRILRLLENRSQAKDHPTVLTIPETAYLKCVVAHVS